MSAENLRDELFDSGLRLSLEDEEIIAAVSQLSDDEEGATETAEALKDAVVAARQDLEAMVAEELTELEKVIQDRAALEDKLLAATFPALVAEIAAHLRDGEAALQEVLGAQRVLQDEIDEIDAADRRIAREAEVERATAAAAEVERATAAAEEAIRRAEATIEQRPQSDDTPLEHEEPRPRRRWRRLGPRRAEVPEAAQEPDAVRVSASLRERREKAQRSMTDLATVRYSIDRQRARTEAEAARQLAPGRQQLREHSDLLEIDHRLSALTQTVRQSLVEKAIKPYCRNWLSEALDQKLQQRYSSVLAVEFTGGLGERASADQEVPTHAHARLQRLLDQLPGGSIGISGPRGSGKSTLLRAFCSDGGRIKGRPPSLAINVSAPVDYVPRDFVLHLFATLCHAALRPSGHAARRLRTSIDDAGFASRDRLLFELAPKAVGVAAVVACLTGTGLAASRVARGALDTTHDQLLWSAAALLAAILLWIATLRWSRWARVQKPRRRHAEEMRHREDPTFGDLGPQPRRVPLPQNHGGTLTAVGLLACAAVVLTVDRPPAASDWFRASDVWGFGLIYTASFIWGHSRSGAWAERPPYPDDSHSPPDVSSAGRSSLEHHSRVVTMATMILLVASAASLVVAAALEKESAGAGVKVGALLLVVVGLTTPPLMRWIAAPARPELTSAPRGERAQWYAALTFEGGRALLAIAATVVTLAAALTSFGWITRSTDLVLAMGLDLIAVGIVLLMVGRRLDEAVPAQPASVTDERPYEDAPGDLATTAQERLDEITSQRTFTAGWSGALKVAAPLQLPLALEAGVTGSTSTAMVPMTLPEITDSFRGFVREATAKGPVVIGIDELDKIGSEERASAFLNEIKAVFGVDDCYYLISVSEDAVASFERRGLPFRDVFDSAFEEIMRVRHFDLEGAVHLVRSRVIGVPVPFVGFCYCLSGGLPRDLIRTTRALFDGRDMASSSELPVLTGLLLSDDLATKREATISAVAKYGHGQVVRASLHWLGNLSHGVDLRPDLAALNAAGACFRALSPLLDPSPEAAAIHRLLEEFLAYWYFCATLAEFFDARVTADRMMHAEDPETGFGGLAHLAKARQSFAVDPRVAWTKISEFRSHWNMTVEAPARLREPGQRAATDHN